MQLCYIDESGTPELTGNTSHFVLAGISVLINIGANTINSWRRSSQITEWVTQRFMLPG